MKKILIYLFILLSSLLLTKPTYAANLTVTCNGASCTTSPFKGAALFEEPDIKPGYNIYRRFTVTNNGGDDCSLYMNTYNVDDLNNLRQTLFTVINNGSIDLFGATAPGGGAASDKNFANLFGLPSLYLGTIPGNGGNRTYFWNVTMDPNAGNAYQGKTMKFDFDLNFECGRPPSCPNLVITKTNDKKEAHAVLGVNDVVHYTVKVTNNSDIAATNVRVEDVQPVQSYFDYDENSGILTKPDSTTVPLIAAGSNPFFWSLGNIGPHETYTLTYNLKILSTAIPGTHYNIAIAISDNVGVTTEQSRVSNCFSQPVLDPFDVGQQGISGSYSGEVKSEQTGAVLGAATTIGQVLGAATGSPTAWLILAIVLLSLGSIVKLYRRFKS